MAKTQIEARISKVPKQYKIHSNSKINDRNTPDILIRLNKGETLKSISILYNTSDMSIHRLKVKHKNAILL